jgi:trans-aconitate methyltransferase
MSQKATASLYSKPASVAFYENRYARGYMEEWPIEKKRRIAELIQSLELPGTGEALDFGCGNGVLTDFLRVCLPKGWTTCGSDLSSNAIQNARKWYPACRFFLDQDSELQGRKFDLLFTHHVLEHVYDLPKTLAAMSACLKPQAAMLHILPCGNPGSFEHSICLLRADGINLQMEGRFFFEDEGHVRRLNTEQMVRQLKPFGFSLVKENYANQHRGAIDWISRSGPGFVRRFTDPSAAHDDGARKKLRQLRRSLMLLSALRRAAPLLESRLRRKHRRFSDWMLILAGLPFYLLAKPTDLYLKRQADKEWRDRRTERNGSEMYLLFRT